MLNTVTNPVLSIHRFISAGLDIVRLLLIRKLSTSAGVESDASGRAASSTIFSAKSGPLMAAIRITAMPKTHMATIKRITYVNIRIGIGEAYALKSYEKEQTEALAFVCSTLLPTLDESRTVDWVQVRRKLCVLLLG